MRKRETDNAVRALLVPDEPGTIDAGYIDRLLDAFEEHRSTHAREVAGWAADSDLSLPPENTAAVRARYLDTFLRYTAHDMQDVLRNLMASEDCERAALLYLHGHASGFWKATESELSWARELCGQGVQQVNAKPNIATELEPLTWADLGPSATKTKTAAHTKRAKAKALTKAELAEWKAQFELLHMADRVRQRMHTVLADPSTSENGRLTAIIAYFDALEFAGCGDIVRDVCRPGALLVAEMFKTGRMQ